MVNCPECDAEIDLDEDDLDEGDLIICDECGAEFRVAGTNPLELEPAEEEEGEEDGPGLDEDEEEDWR